MNEPENKLKKMSIGELADEYTRIAKESVMDFNCRLRISELVRDEAKKRSEYKDVKEIFEQQVEEKGNWGVTMGLKEVYSSDDQVKAYKKLMELVMERFSKGGTWQELETCCWVENKRRAYAIPFYDVKDWLWKEGYLKKENDKVVFTNKT